MNELLCSSASGMARAIREKKISSAELMPAHLERIEGGNPRLNLSATAVFQLHDGLQPDGLACGCGARSEFR